MSIMSLVARGGAKVAHIAVKYAPEAMAVIGTGCVIGGTVMACKDTLKATEVIDAVKDDLDKIEEAEVLAEEKSDLVTYSKEDRNRDKAMVYFNGAKSFGKVYWKAAAVEGIGLALLLGAFGIMKKRYSGAIAAAHTIEAMYRAYRERVIEAEGIAKDEYYRTGWDGKMESLPAAEGEEEKAVRVMANVPNGSGYSRLFDEANIYWVNSSAQNRFFLEQVQAKFNDKLDETGHVFLNEVLEALGFPHTKEGAIVGWVKNGDGDGFIDFGIYSIPVEHDDDYAAKRDFINGYAASLWLDFNVDGVIFDLI